MKKMLISLSCLIFFGISYAQNEFEEGFIVKLNGDTLYGIVKDRKEAVFTKLYKKVRFKENGKNSKKKYGADQIRAYAIGSQMFHSVPENTINDGLFNFGQSSSSSKDDVFLKVILSGPASYYQQEWVEQESGIVEVADYIKKENDTVLIRSTLGLLGLRKKRVSSYFSDCPPLQLKIKNKELVTSFEVVQFYNNWILDKDH